MTLNQKIKVKNKIKGQEERFNFFECLISVMKTKNGFWPIKSAAFGCSIGLSWVDWVKFMQPFAVELKSRYRKFLRGQRNFVIRKCKNFGILLSLGSNPCMNALLNFIQILPKLHFWISLQLLLNLFQLMHTT